MSAGLLLKYAQQVVLLRDPATVRQNPEVKFACFYEFACAWMLSFCPQNTDKATPECDFERLVASFIVRAPSAAAMLVSIAAPAPAFTAPANTTFDLPTATSTLLMPGKCQSFLPNSPANA
ncbi:hypothetical protein [Pseudomonas amygdali]|uniref:hypothetical protein n=1 Tax=Pseudomonas amygdali TaxID=47877 RepID=UPI000A94C167|nr:hypothetical protein [Pseudomonas amygdali]UNO24570.1 hypothetical protein MDO45_19500 [Pseudomonas amygdali pv. aesculi]